MNVIRRYCPNPEELLNASYLGAGSLLRIESSTTQVGGYAELGTVALVAGTYFYTYYHAAGTPGLWYQIRYSNAGGTVFTAYEAAYQDGGQTTLSRLEHIRRLVNPDNPTDTSHDGELLTYMQQVTDLIHTMIERYFLPIPMDPSATATLTFDGQWGNSKAYGSPWGGQGPSNRYDRLFIAQGVRSITSLKIRMGGTGSTQVTVPAAAYVIRPSSDQRDPGQPGQYIELVYPPAYTFLVMGSDVIEVVGTFGYASVPPLIEGISDRTVLRAWRARGAGLGGGMSGPETDPAFIRWTMSYEDNQLLQSHFSEWPLVK